jgi:hypothetical protein
MQRGGATAGAESVPVQGVSVEPRSRPGSRGGETDLVTEITQERDLTSPPPPPPPPPPPSELDERYRKDPDPGIESLTDAVESGRLTRQQAIDISKNPLALARFNMSPIERTESIERQAKIRFSTPTGRENILRRSEEGERIPRSEFPTQEDADRARDAGVNVDYTGWAFRNIERSTTGFYRAPAGGTFVERDTDLTIRQEKRGKDYGKREDETDEQFAQRKKDIATARGTPGKSYQDVKQERLRRTGRDERVEAAHRRQMELAEAQPGGLDVTKERIEAGLTEQQRAIAAQNVRDAKQHESAENLLEMEIEGNTNIQQILVKAGFEVEQLKGKTSKQLAEMASENNIDLATITQEIETLKNDTQNAAIQSQERISLAHDKAQVEIAGLDLDKAELVAAKERSKAVADLIKQRNLAVKAGHMDMVGMIDDMIAKADPKFAAQTKGLRRRSLVSGLKAAIGTAEPWFAKNVGEDFYAKLSGMISSLELVENAMGEENGKAAFYASAAANDLAKLDRDYKRLLDWGKGDPGALARLGDLLKEVRTTFDSAKAADDVTKDAKTQPEAGAGGGEREDLMVGPDLTYRYNPNTDKYFLVE